MHLKMSSDNIGPLLLPDMISTVRHTVRLYPDRDVYNNKYNPCRVEFLLGYMFYICTFDRFSKRRDTVILTILMTVVKYNPGMDRQLHPF